MTFASASRCLIFVVIVCFVAREHQAAISHLEPQISDEQSNSKQEPIKYVSTVIRHHDTPLSAQQKRATSVPRQFLIITTGDDIKLYPFNGQEQQNQQHKAGDLLQTLSNHYYHIKPSILISTSIDSYTRKYGNTTLARWLYEDAERNRTIANQNGKSNQTTLRKWNRSSPKVDSVSILPQGLEDGFRDSNKTGYRKPHISDVDYFLDSRFCRPDGDSLPSPESLCLVIVWLDSSNRLVRYGSINLANIVVSNQKPNPKANTMAWLEEFKPIDLNNYLNFNGRPSSTKHLSYPFGIAIDKRRLKIHVAFRESARSLPLSFVLTGEFKVKNRQKFETEAIQVEKVRLHSAVECQAAKGGPTEVSQGFIFDEITGDWLFHLNGGKIFVAFVGHPKQSTNAITDLSSYHGTNYCSSKDGLIRVLIGGITHEPSRAYRSDEHQSPSSSAVVAMDSRRSRIYWVTKDKKLISSDSDGDDVRYYGALPPRPKLLKPTSMRIHHDTIFISDSVKKSLLAYKITQPRGYGSSHSDTLRKGVNSNIQYSSVDQSKSSQVLLVGMTPIQGFRIIDLDDGSANSWRLSEYKSSDSEKIETISADADVIRVKIETYDYNPMGDHEIELDGFVSLPDEQLEGRPRSLFTDDFDPLELFLGLNSDGSISDTRAGLPRVLVACESDDQELGSEAASSYWCIVFIGSLGLISTISGMVLIWYTTTISQKFTDTEINSNCEKTKCVPSDNYAPPGYSISSTSCLVHEKTPSQIRLV